MYNKYFRHINRRAWETKTIICEHSTNFANNFFWIRYFKTSTSKQKVPRELFYGISTLEKALTIRQEPDNWYTPSAIENYQVNL